MPGDSVLIVAWYFPPDGGAGSQRPASFARELPKFGWQTSVLTRGTRHERGKWETLDESLLRDMGADVRVERVEEPGTDNQGFLIDGGEIPDRARPLCDRVLEVVDRERPDVVLMTMSPFFFSSLVEPLRAVGDTRIVLDLRDPWALDYWMTYRNRSRYRAHLQLMLDVLTRVDGVVMNTSSARRELLNAFDGQTPSGFEQRVAVIENGYTRSDFSENTSAPSSESLVITHTGTFHCEHLRGNRSLLQYLGSLRRYSRVRTDRTGRTPFHLLRAAAKLSSEEPEFGKNVRFRFIGHIDDPLRRCVQGSGIADRVTIEGYRSHDDAVEAMCTAGALFLPGASLPAGFEDLIVPGKTYEYLASGRPILGAIHQGDARQLLERAGGAYLCDPCNQESIIEQLKRLHGDWSSGSLQSDDLRDESVVKNYERTHLAERLSTFLGQVRELPRIEH